MQGVIYSTSGRAREYEEHAINIYSGCGHLCKYCYGPDIIKISKELWENPIPRDNILERVKLEASAFKGKTVQLCFVTDPYQPINDQLRLTREIIKVLHENEVRVSILTKGGRRSVQDIDLLSNNPELSKYGTTLTFMETKDSLEWESGAALPSERIEALKIMHDAGIETWVSMEPVIEPRQTFQLIKMTHEFVDIFKIGTLNYHPHAETIDWRQFGESVISILNRIGANYYIKNDLRNKMLPSTIIKIKERGR